MKTKQGQIWGFANSIGSIGATPEIIKYLASYVSKKRAYFSNEPQNNYLANLHKATLYEPYKYSDNKNDLLETMDKYVIDGIMPVYIHNALLKEGVLLQYDMALNLLSEFDTLKEALEAAGYSVDESSVSEILTKLEKIKSIYPKLKKFETFFGHFKSSEIRFIRIIDAKSYLGIDLKELRKKLGTKKIKTKKVSHKVQINFNIPYTPVPEISIDSEIFNKYFYQLFRPFYLELEDRTSNLYAKYGDQELSYFSQFLRLLSYVDVFFDLETEKFFVGVSPFAFSDYVNGEKPLYGKHYNYMQYGDLYIHAFSLDIEDDGDGGMPEIVPDPELVLA